MDSSILLRKVQKRILNNPKQVNMSFFCSEDNCGTIACIAGWIIIESGFTPEQVKSLGQIYYEKQNAVGKASELLGIPSSDVRRLFYSEHWPNNLDIELNKHKPGSTRYGRVVSKAISLFIKHPEVFKYGQGCYLDRAPYGTL